MPVQQLRLDAAAVEKSSTWLSNERASSNGANRRVYNDVRPDPPLPRTGRGLHYCLHCDAHMFVIESVYVMGHTESAAHAAGIMLNFTDEVDLLTRGDFASLTNSMFS